MARRAAPPTAVTRAAHIEITGIRICDGDKVAGRIECQLAAKLTVTADAAAESIEPPLTAMDAHPSAVRSVCAPPHRSRKPGQRIASS